MTWSGLFGVMLLSHLLGDFILQTNWQAACKLHGLGADREARRALASHALFYTLAFLPALVWVGLEADLWIALLLGALLLCSHAVIDDGTLVAWWSRRVKHVEGTPTTVVRLGVDQSLHIFILAGAALIATL